MNNHITFLIIIFLFTASCKDDEPLNPCRQEIFKIEFENQTDLTLGFDVVTFRCQTEVQNWIMGQSFTVETRGTKVIEESALNIEEVKKRNNKDYNFWVNLIYNESFW